ncbi:hypothetical protein I4641_20440 [Waterburya agarophytonicola K14]|uniref:PatA-like N-terminal domain-containing protein n=1 Tax=Waterburya agarophytonicola KI4 TaxID=2874699 RepID=A0A964BUC7_9CYAN|nr:DUF4388 domain-containing protein [Waterburya agarophytonicola]MCC0179334.1 hypothetical protein [Waterburya agarophytonicola KI4]
MSANNKLGEQLISLSRQKFTGILTITSQDSNLEWKIFFYQGQYLWTEGGLHVNRSWQRNFNYYCPNVNTDVLVLRHQPEIQSYNYSLLNVLLQRKIVERKQVKALIQNRSQEVFFDLLQQEYNNSLNYDTQITSAHHLLKAGFNLSLNFINLEQALFQAQTSWSTWGAKGLASCSPHHAPFLKSDGELKKQLPDVVFSNMSRLLNGKNTLRDLAFKMEKSVLDITCGIVPYFFKGYLRFLEIPDLPEIKIK